ncbi:MAG: CDP-alcohol phosphatidyltransferase family protein [Deltaproteobacteria bacterium]|nr:CDP-alcohol phosphatidyltransferase family protein [Deltaproteobacteria bacterium]
MSLLDGYRASLKPLEIEEPIDVYVHRPLGYLVAKLTFHTPISPDLITLLSIFVGVSGGVVMLTHVAYRMQIGAALIFLSAVLDCADGQLARMRKTSSAFGRMIDGVADLFVIGTVAPVSLFIVWQRYNSPTWLGVTVVLLGLATFVTSSFHTTTYDHCKNVYLRLTSPTYKDGEDYESALDRWKQTHATQAWWKRIAWRIYLFYLGSQRDYALKFDPWTSARLNLFPPYDEKRAEIYRRHVRPIMRVLKGFYGFGSLVFGLALVNFFDRAEVLLLFRLIILNAVFYLYIRPAQRRASRAAFKEMGIRLPDQPEESQA